MNLNIKLKDCTLTDIESDIGTEKEYDWYGEICKAVVSINFIFSDGTDVCFNDIDSESGSFTYLANFFYQKDFSEYTKDQFISEFSEHVDVNPRYYKTQFKVGDIVLVNENYSKQKFPKHVSRVSSLTSVGVIVDGTEYVNCVNYFDCGYIHSTIKKLNNTELELFIKDVMNNSDITKTKKQRILGEFYPKEDKK